MKHIIIAITGASGGLYALRLLRALLTEGHHAHVILSKFGRYVLHDETLLPSGGALRIQLTRLYGEDIMNGELTEYKIGDLAAPIASGSVRWGAPRWWPGAGGPTTGSSTPWVS